MDALCQFEGRADRADNARLTFQPKALTEIVNRFDAGAVRAHNLSDPELLELVRGSGERVRFGREEVKPA